MPVFLISLKAGGTGLNLTGADVVIHYDPWWNLAVQNQATDRAHRIGQKNIVTVYKLIAKNSIEEKILEMQEAKKHLADEILSGEMGGLSALTKDELMALLNSYEFLKEYLLSLSFLFIIEVRKKEKGRRENAFI